MSTTQRIPFLCRVAAYMCEYMLYLPVYTFGICVDIDLYRFCVVFFLHLSTATYFARYVCDTLIQIIVARAQIPCLFSPEKNDDRHTHVHQTKTCSFFWCVYACV